MFVCFSVYGCYVSSCDMGFRSVTVLSDSRDVLQGTDREVDAFASHVVDGG